MSGYRGQLLRINLTTGNISREKIDPVVAVKFIGGRGLGTYYLTREVAPTIDALSTENKLFFATGPLTGSSAPASGRYMVITKSPLSGTVACSNSGGYWGPELKFAGYDMLIVEGQAPKPSYISIRDDQVEIRDARQYWGKLVGQTTADLRSACRDDHAKVMAIGPAGEQLSPIAAIMNDKYRAAGRSGVGAVFGSKNLKAIVVRGSGKVEAACPEKARELHKTLIGKLREQDGTSALSPFSLNTANQHTLYPTQNFQTDECPGHANIPDESLAEKYLTGSDVCYRCPIPCGRYCQVSEKESTDSESETIQAFSADCGIDDLPTLIRANHLCNEYGLDVISAGSTLACAMELFEKGHIKPDELGNGPELEFGSNNAVLEWTRRMAAGEGLGSKLAKGSQRLVEMYNAKECFKAVKKSASSACNVRDSQRKSLEGPGNSGGVRSRGYIIAPEILGLPEKLDPLSLEGKAFWAKAFQDITAVIDSLGLCLFTAFAETPDDYCQQLNLSIGTNLTTEQLAQTGERIWNLERQFNIAAGLDPHRDTLPKSILKAPIPQGPQKGQPHHLDKLLPEYYSLRGWTAEGIPTEEKLVELGLK